MPINFDTPSLPTQNARGCPPPSKPGEPADAGDAFALLLLAAEPPTVAGEPPLANLHAPAEPAKRNDASESDPSSIIVALPTLPAIVANGEACATDAKSALAVVPQPAPVVAVDRTSPTAVTTRAPAERRAEATRAGAARTATDASAPRMPFVDLATHSPPMGDAEAPCVPNAMPHPAASPQVAADDRAPVTRDEVRTATPPAALAPHTVETLGAATAKGLVDDSAASAAPQSRPHPSAAPASFGAFAPLPPLHATAHSLPIAQAIAIPIADARFAGEAAHRIAQIVIGGQGSAELRVSPPELGPVQIHVDLKADQASVAILATHADTRQALEQMLPQLRDLLAAQGIALGQATVHDGSTGRHDARESPHAVTRDDDARSDAAPQRATRVAPLRDRLIDTFA
jgi:flagellar hook-length control protein FliK